MFLFLFHFSYSSLFWWKKAAVDNRSRSDSSQQVFPLGTGKTAEHPEVGLNNPKGLHFSNHNRGVIYVPVTRRDLDPDWALRRHAIDPHSQESQLPLKPWQWNCTASIGSAVAPTILFIEESSIHYSLMSDNWWQVGPCFLPWPRQTESQMDYI